jgi:hypothetical protein
MPVLPEPAEEAIFSGRVAATDPPLPILGVQVASYWHKRQDRDGGLIWLRTH